MAGAEEGTQTRWEKRRNRHGFHQPPMDRAPPHPAWSGVQAQRKPWSRPCRLDSPLSSPADNWQKQGLPSLDSGSQECTGCSELGGRGWGGS